MFPNFKYQMLNKRALTHYHSNSIHFFIVRAHVREARHTWVAVIGQLLGVGSLLPPCGFWRWNKSSCAKSQLARKILRKECCNKLKKKPDMGFLAAFNHLCSRMKDTHERHTHTQPLYLRCLKQHNSWAAGKIERLCVSLTLDHEWSKAGKKPWARIWKIYLLQAGAW